MILINPPAIIIASPFNKSLTIPYTSIITPGLYLQIQIYISNPTGTDTYGDLFYQSSKYSYIYTL